MLGLTEDAVQGLKSEIYISTDCSV